MSDIWQDQFREILTGLEAAGDPDVIRMTYWPVDGARVEDVLTMLTRSVSYQPGGMDSQIQTRVLTIEAALDDLGKDPEMGEQFLAPDRTTYTVLAILENDGHTATMQVKS